MLPANSCNLVFICDVLHLVRNRPAFLGSIVRALKPAGEVAVIDFYKREAPVGPPLPMKLTEEEVTKDFLKAGFRLNKQLSPLPILFHFHSKEGRMNIGEVRSTCVATLGRSPNARVPSTA
jgi:ubiquinone/menaquinone biosynthesis C-methylase UbiE